MKKSGAKIMVLIFQGLPGKITKLSFHSSDLFFPFLGQKKIMCYHCAKNKKVVTGAFFIFL